MPAAIPVIGAAFLAAGSVATAIGLGTAFMIGATAISWATVLTVTGVALMAVTALSMKIPKPESGGGQISVKLDPKAPVPVLYGRSASGGYVGYRQTYGSKNKYLALVALLSVGPIQQIESYTASDQPLAFVGDPHTGLRNNNGIEDSKLYRNKLRMRYQLGETPAPLTVTQAAANEPLPGTPGKLSGLAHTISIYEYDTDQFPQGLPKSLWVAKGIKLYDPRKDSTYPGGSGSHRIDNHATWEYSENPFLAALDWTLGRWYNGKKVYGIGAKWSEVDVAAFVTGANVADANNWKVGGVVVSTDDKMAVLSTLLQSGGGLPVARGAQISCTVNAPKTSTFTIQASDILGEVEVQNSTSWRDRANTVVPSYREESQLWEIIAGEHVSSSTYVDEDGGEQKTIEVEFPLVQQAAQAHQLAVYELVNSREFLTFSLVGKLRLLNVRVGDAVTVNLPQIGANGQKCIVVSREFNPADQTVSLALKSETDGKHAFALGQSQTAPASPSLSGYNPAEPGAPGEDAWTLVGGTITKDGVSVPALVLNGENDDPNTSAIIVEYRPSGTTMWFSGGTYAKNTTQIELMGVTKDTAYDVAISYRTVWGVVSERLVKTATTGEMSIDWAAGVITGSTKPEDNATVGAPSGTMVAGVLAEDLISNLGGKGLLDNTPPAQVISVSASSVITDNGAKITITWAASAATDLNGYVVAIKEGSGSFVNYTTTANRYEIDGLKRNQAYSVQVQAYDKGGNYGSFSSLVSHTTVSDAVPPAAPTGFAATASFQNVYLTWTNPADLDLAGVEVYENSTNNSGTATKISTVAALPSQLGGYTHSGLTSGSTHYYWLKAVDTSGNKSGFGAVQSITTAPVSEADFSPTASGIAPIKIVSALPSSGNYEGRVVYLSTDDKLYRYTGSAWISNIAAADITGQLTNAQILSIDAAKLTSQIVATQISDGAISTPKLAAGAVTANEIAGNTITGAKVAAGTITGTNIAGSTITGGNIAADTITGGNIAAAAITTSELAAGAVTASKLAIFDNENLVINNKVTNSSLDGWSRITASGTSAIYAAGPVTSWPSPYGIYLFRGTNNNEVSITNGVTSFDDASLVNGISVNPNDEFYVEAIIWTTNASTYAQIDMVVRGNDGVVAGLSGVSLAGQMVKLTGTFKNTTGKTGKIFVRLFNQNGNPQNSEVYFWNVICRRRNNGQLIVDGAITTNHMTANTINGDRVTAGTLNADKIQSNTSLPASLYIGSTGYTLSTQASALNNASGDFNSINGFFNGWAGTYPDNFAIWDSHGTHTKVAGEVFPNAYRGTSVASFNSGLMQHQGNGHAPWVLKPNQWIVIEADIKLNSGSLVAAGILVRGAGTAECVLSFATDKDSGGTVNGAGTAGQTYRFRKLVWSGSGGNTGSEMYMMNHWDGFGSLSGTNDITWYRIGWRYASTAEIDPGATINSNGNATLIDPGKITISGSTTLSNWRYGGDTTQINGGAVAANTIAANRLTIGNRNLGFIGLNFEWNPSNNYVYWSDGYIYYIDNNGNNVTQNIVAGNSGGASAHRWFYWTPGTNYIQMTQTDGLANNDSNVFIGAWWGGSNLNINYGGTIAHGDRITTGTISANKLNVGQLSAITANIGLLRTATSGARTEISDNVIKVYDSSNVLRVQIGDLSL
ncbi:fibronectin type III domain-containing protein [Sphingobium sp. PNB]|uniref:fibronectin type III domain-containing protein n=1 Tax=Sphingobium sp. PNB TaxID=863934 RepID=UPI001CA40340|nr:fibronectin type III domain-containing protein [Sphingobium sp. PNB]MCB4861979.1 fibronectin type III domain-containing protein [Sphingobium sp. PNB]